MFIKNDCLIFTSFFSYNYTHQPCRNLSQYREKIKNLFKNIDFRKTREFKAEKSLKRFEKVVIWYIVLVKNI